MNTSTLNFYNISTNFTISKTKELELPSGIVINDAFYDDSLQCLIVASHQHTYSINSSSYTIRKTIVNPLTCFCMSQIKNDKTGQYDLFVVVCYNEPLSSSYYIEMRRVGDLSLVFNYTLNV